ncbi:conserved hypothetical protein [gamma proteobacterium HTCC5015]|nr:conserved hypothetical protein [gamma proteobacterium HTCC5015]
MLENDHSTPAAVAVHGITSADEKCGIAWCESIQLNIDSQSRWQLQFDADTTTLIDQSRDSDTCGYALTIDWVGGKAGHRRQFGGGRGQPLAKAVGLKAGLTPHIVDATGGLGRDAFVLATLGCSITLIERHPIIYSLLYSAHQRALACTECCDIAQRIQLIHDDASQWLQHHSDVAQVIYLDPMYPHRNKSALVKKDMRLFRALAGDDQDANQLLDAALSSGAARVVVKRPKGAAPLGQRPASSAVSSKNTRYDLYPLRKIQASTTGNNIDE